MVKTLSTFTDDEHELAALDEVGNHSFDGLPLPSLDAKSSTSAVRNLRLGTHYHSPR